MNDEATVLKNYEHMSWKYIYLKDLVWCQFKALSCKANPLQSFIRVLSLNLRLLPCEVKISMKFSWTLDSQGMESRSKERFYWFSRNCYARVEHGSALCLLSNNFHGNNLRIPIVFFSCLAGISFLVLYTVWLTLCAVWRRWHWRATAICPASVRSLWMVLPRTELHHFDSTRFQVRANKCSRTCDLLHCGCLFCHEIAQQPVALKVQQARKLEDFHPL